VSLYDQIAAIVDRVVGRRIDYCHPWPGTIVSQSGDTVDFSPDDHRLPDLVGVPIRTGVAGVRVTVANGARARAHFDDGSPAKPFVALWDLGSVVSIDMAATGGQPVARQGDLVIVTIPPSEIVKMVAALGLSNSGGPVVPGPGAASAALQGAGYISSGSAIVRST